MRNRCSAVAVLLILCLNVVSGLAQPSPQARSGSSSAVERRVESLLSQMTLEEKIDMLGGVDRRALSYYDVSAKQWRAEPGDYDVLVGPSSAQIELRGEVNFSPTASGR